MKRLPAALALAMACLATFAGVAAAGYRDLGDGSVLDTDTGLAWESAAASQVFAWEEALAHCEALTTGGHTDWRLPNIRELGSLFEYSLYMPTVDTRFYASHEGNSYHWSSTSYLGSATAVVAANLYYGSYFGFSKSTTLLIRCVRDGSIPAPVQPGLNLLLLDQ